MVWGDIPKTLSCATSSLNSGQPWKPLDSEIHQKCTRGTDRALRSPSAHDTYNPTSWYLPISTTQRKIFRTCNEPWLRKEGFNYWKGKVSVLSDKKKIPYINKFIKGLNITLWHQWFCLCLWKIYGTGSYKKWWISYNRFVPVLSTAVDRTLSPYAIKETFRKTGIFPLNPGAIDNNQLALKKPINRISSGSKENQGVRL